MKWEISGKGRNLAKDGYYMLLIIAAPDVRDHLSDREVSTVLFLPASKGEENCNANRAIEYFEVIIKAYRRAPKIILYIEPTHKLKIDQKKLQNCKSNI